MMFDTQQFFNLVVAVGGFLGIFVFNQIMQRLQRLEDENKALREGLPEKYVQKEDYRSDMHDIKAMLKQIYEKLDGKADKAG